MLFLKCQLCPHCWMNRGNFKVLCRKCSSGVIIQSGRWQPQMDPLIFHLVSFPSVHFPIKRSWVHLRYWTAAVNYFSALSNFSQQMNTVREEGIQPEVTKKKGWKKEMIDTRPFSSILDPFLTKCGALVSGSDSGALSKRPFMQGCLSLLTLNENRWAILSIWAPEHTTYPTA